MPLSLGGDDEASGQPELLCEEARAHVPLPVDLLIGLPPVTIDTGDTGDIPFRAECAIRLDPVKPRAGKPLIVQGDNDRDPNLRAYAHQIPC